MFSNKSHPVKLSTLQIIDRAFDPVQIAGDVMNWWSPDAEADPLQSDLQLMHHKSDSPEQMPQSIPISGDNSSLGWSL